MCKWLLSSFILFISIASYADLDCSSQSIKNAAVQQQCKKINQISSDAIKNYNTRFFEQLKQSSVSIPSTIPFNNNTSPNSSSFNQQGSSQTNSSTQPDVDNIPVSNTNNQQPNPNNNSTNIKYY